MNYFQLAELCLEISELEQSPCRVSCLDTEYSRSEKRDALA